MTPLLDATARALLEALAGHQPLRLAGEGAVPSAVLMPLWEREGRVEVLFTKRTSRLPQHAGQISFPGGSRDPGDLDDQATALRETEEELGITPSQIEVVARLDQILTVTNFLVTPFVGLVSPAARAAPNPAEVAALLWVPLATVLDPSRYQDSAVPWRGWSSGRRPALRGRADLGATGRMLLNPWPPSTEGPPGWRRCRGQGGAS